MSMSTPENKEFKHGKPVTHDLNGGDPAVVVDQKNGGHTIILGQQFTDDRDHNHAVRTDEKYSRCPTPIGFKGELMPHQQTDVASMLNLEDSGEIKIQLRSGSKTVKTVAGLLSEPFGSGKTVVVLALLLQRAIPENRPLLTSVPLYGAKGKRSQTCAVIHRKFGDSRIIRPALLMVAASVVLQWKTAISRFTNMRAFVVTNVRKLRELQKLIKNGDVNTFDIILVKNGNVTGEFHLEKAEPKNKKHTRKIYNLIANVTRTHVWSRLIVDDFDVIKLPKPPSVINALFTWFISATKFTDNTTHQYRYSEDYKSIIMKPDLNIAEQMGRGHLMQTFNVCNAPSYTERSVSIGKPVFWVHKLKNPNGRYVRMIGAMAGDNARDIMEMLNADAIGEAAELAGIDTNNIGDIFKGILQGQYQKYAQAVDVLKFIDTIDMVEIEHLNEPENIEDVYYQKHVYQKRPILYKYPNIVEKINAVSDECKASRTESGKAIDRVKDNIKEGDCPVCCCELEGDAAIIIKCCGVVLCADCGTQSTNLCRNNNRITGKCPHCRAVIAFTDLIFMGEDMKLDDIVTDNIEKPAVEEVVDVPEQKVNTIKTKFDILLRIIKGEELPDKKQEHVSIPGMLEGIKELPEAPADKRKTIIFSRFDEALDGMAKNLTQAGVSFKRLGGTAEQINALANEFQDSYDGTNVLLINGEKYSSGLNLQSATDLVFMHKIVDKNIEAQIVGRVQRLGRVYKAHVHYVLYDEEVGAMNFR
jgi:SNF2 family DNA or RNA helicase